MDKDEEKIMNFKPTTWFTVWLFIYFVSLVTETLRFAKQLSNFGIETYSEPDYSWSLLAFSTLLRALFVLYSFKTITLCLSGHPNAISALRWSLFINIVYSYGNVFGKIEILNNPTISFILLFEFFFLLFFWLYTFFSRSIKKMFPKSYRRKFLWGIVGLSLFLLYMAFMALLIFSQNRVKGNSVPIRVKSLALKKGEYADSLTIYRALSDWKYKKRIYETTYFENPRGLDIRVRSINLPDRSRTMFCAFLGSFLSDDHVAIPKEQSYFDTIIDEKKLYSSVYKMSKPDGVYYAQVIGVYDKDSYKAVLFFVRGDKIPLFSPESVSQICQGIDFRLEKRVVKK